MYLAARCLACTWFNFLTFTACTSLVTLLARLPGWPALHAGIVQGDTEQDTGEAEWGNCHFHMRGRRGENQTIEVFKYFKLSHEGREGEGCLRKPNY